MFSIQFTEAGVCFITATVIFLCCIVRDFIPMSLPWSKMALWKKILATGADILVCLSIFWVMIYQTIHATSAFFVSLDIGEIVLFAVLVFFGVLSQTKWGEKENPALTRLVTVLFVVFCLGFILLLFG